MFILYPLHLKAFSNLGYMAMYTEKGEIGETCWYIEDERGNRISGQTKCIRRGGGIGTGSREIGRV